MKKKFVAKKQKSTKKLKLFLLFFVFLISLLGTFRFLLKSNVKIDDKTLVNLLLDGGSPHINVENKNMLAKLASLLIRIDLTDPSTIIKGNYASLVKQESPKKLEMVEDVSSTSPIIYIYNTHQTEEYASSNFAEFSVNPTVFMADYIMKNKFDEASMNTIVEERSVKELLNLNSWSYAASYDASKIYMKDAKEKIPSLKYFIDVHRDSLTRDKTTISIGGKSYAKTIFLIGTENPNYEQNLAFTTKLNDRLNEKYPGLSKGIYQKGGEGVNGVYNQNFSPYTILIEMGGKENTVDEVLNSSLAFSEIFLEVILENEG